MKTRDLIAALQENDPSGDMEVCVENVDIFYVDTEPAYYDGCLQVLKRDETKKPFYDVVGAEYRSSGSKIVIHTLSIKSAVYNDPDLEVTFSEYSGSYYRDRVEEYRADARRIEAEFEEERKGR